jgi:hypothetical protein
MECTRTNVIKVLDELDNGIRWVKASEIAEKFGEKSEIIVFLLRNEVDHGRVWSEKIVGSRGKDARYRMNR